MKHDPKEISEVLKLLEDAYNLRGRDLEESISLTHTALKKSRELQSPLLIGKSLSKLALYYMIRGEYESSIKMSEEAINRLRAENDELGVADANYNIAGVYYKTNNYHLGMFHLIDCLTTYKKYKDYHSESKTQKSLGTVYEVLGDQRSAKAAYEGAIEAAIKAKDKNLESNAYNPLSGILLKNNEPEKARELIEKSIRLKQETGDIRGYAFAIYGRGKLHFYLKEYQKAKNDYEEALTIHVDAGDAFGIGMVYNKLAHLYIAQGDRIKAKDTLEMSLSLGKEANHSLLIYKANYFLYTLNKEEGNNEKALAYLEEYLKGKDDAINSQILKVIANYERISKMRSLEKEESLERQKISIVARQEQLEQSAAMKQEFLSAMSHEIRTPLNAVTSIISLLEERSSEKDKKLLKSLQFSSKNLLRIINDILDFSKLESNKMHLDLYPVNINDFLNNIKETYAGLAFDKGIDLRIAIDPQIANAYLLDETKLFQILGNLISNAVKFTQNGHVEMNIDLVTTKGKMDVIRFKVEDTGIGIPAKEKKRLFESFYMPTSITTRSDGGTGLGLAIVKKLVELHDSSIEIESVENEGSVFYFILTLERTHDIQESNEAIYEKLQNKHAVLAEDNEINAMVMRELLKKWGITIKRVKNGLEAVTLARKEKFDFILMDIHMPELNGYDAAEMIRNEDNPNQMTPIFALTADVTAMNKQQQATYFNGFLWKPLQIERLLEALTRVFEEQKNT